MKLNIEQIRAISCGAARVEETDFGVSFFRFTKEQEEMYKERSGDFYMKSFSSSGVTLKFKSDSKNIFLKGRVSKGSSRTFYSIDVTVNGEPVGYIDNFSDIELPEIYAGVKLDIGDFEKNICLGDGEKEVCVYLPWGQKTEFSEISLDDSATVIPVKYGKKLVAFGDSITHGYDALRNYNKYITRFAEAMGCEEYNKAIGGEVFIPSLAALKEDFVPDVITVAYGTNDWSQKEASIYIRRCSEFYENLCANYPDTPIIAITPIWRLDSCDEKKMGAFENTEKFVREVCSKYKNVTVVSGLNLFPQDVKLFADGRLHPNDKGFECYFENLYKEINR